MPEGQWETVAILRTHICAVTCEPCCYTWCFLLGECELHSVTSLKTLVFCICNYWSVFCNFCWFCDADTKSCEEYVVTLHTLEPYSQVLSLISHTLQTLRLHLKHDGTCTETRFRLSAKRTSPFKSVGASVQSTTGSWGACISGSNAGYTMFRGSEKGTG